ncbi:hypothetical protein H5410_001771 [Solanum commersonii]|uniref:Uncharacterized protein n=1 Tax=Solanum commersonii TaxID=4109 RepID=A0A9J6AZZ2_SOLCO|nr:hypothetical protein H5410_001771 [Solanum commersonii]
MGHRNPWSSDKTRCITCVILKIYQIATEGTHEHKQLDGSLFLSNYAIVGSSNHTKVKKFEEAQVQKKLLPLEIGQKLKIVIFVPWEYHRHDIKQEKLNHMWAAVEHKFESVDMNDHHDHILGWMNELWNKWRGHLHAKYVKDKPIQQSLRNVPAE